MALLDTKQNWNFDYSWITVQTWHLGFSFHTFVFHFLLTRKLNFRLALRIVLLLEFNNEFRQLSAFDIKKILNEPFDNSKIRKSFIIIHFYDGFRVNYVSHAVWEFLFLSLLMYIFLHRWTRFCQSIWNSIQRSRAQKKCHSRVKTTWTCEALDDFLFKGQLSDYNDIHRCINVQVAILFLITDMKLDFVIILE